MLRIAYRQYRQERELYMEKTNDMSQIQNYLSALKEADIDALLQRAEEAMAGMLVLNGTGPKPVFVGIPPRWEENPCGIGGYTWTMSRLNYMVTLSKAFLLTGERRYLDKVETDLADWFENVPVPPVPHDYESACYYHGVHNWRMLEVGYRMVYTVPILLSVLRIYGTDKILLGRIYQSIAEHAQRISAGSHLLWPGQDHNHYTEEVNGLLSAAAMIPDHPQASFWLDQAMAGLECACANQITEDGAQIEGTAEYHTAVIVNFAYSIHFAGKCGRSFSAQFVERVKRGMEFAIHTMAPDGTMLPFGDTDAHLYTPVNAACMAFLLFGDVRYLSTVRQFMDSERILRLFAVSCPWGFARITDLIGWIKKPLEKGVELLPLCNYQRQMDQYIFRSGWNRNAACLFFSCHSPIHYGNHAHMDQLGIIFGAYGKMLLQDPGRYTYKSCEDRHLYKSSQVHNVPTIGGRDAFAYLDTFAYGPQKDGEIHEVMETERMKGAWGTHLNYDPVEISRSVALLDGKILLIADTFNHLDGEEMKIFFHMNSINVYMEGQDTVTKDNINIRIIPVESDTHWDVEILDGRLSDVFYHDYPSSRTAYSCKGIKGRKTVLFLAVPFLKGEENRPEYILWEDDVLSFQFGEINYRIRYKEGMFDLLS